ncbi:MAG: TIGR01212 family radical SAM protein [Bacteroidota bacterium]|nr:TIGR01212 family radical SAM protein [Bacteroidota bacterium]
MQQKPWNDYPGFIRQHFGERVQKISVNTGLGCPNLDGTISRKGCTYCDRKSFSPFYCSAEKSITQQLYEGIAFFSKKYKTQQYLAYFQNYTNTYTDFTTFKKLINEALSVPDVIGLVIATRPDSISQAQIELLDNLGKTMFVSVEFGVESTLDDTLKFVNRGHDFACTRDTFKRCADKRFFTGAHLIMGFPGETKKDMINHVYGINTLRPDFLKLHQLQVLRHTAMEKTFEQDPGKFVIFTTNDYISLVADFLVRLDPAIIVERFTSESPQDIVISPNWKGLKNFEFVEKLRAYMKSLHLYQGKMFNNHENN